MKLRVRAIILQGNSLLLIHRVKGERVYWVFPGGGVEMGESIQDAMAREVQEELGVKVSVGDVFTEHQLNAQSEEGEQREIFLFCNILSGELGSGTGPEFRQGTGYEGTYIFEWVRISDLTSLDVLPREVKEKFLREVAKL
jgi:8-oxo-dGTP diphosphatase